MRKLLFTMFVALCIVCGGDESAAQRIPFTLRLPIGARAAETDLRCLRSGSFHSHPTVSRSAQRARWVGPKQVRYNYGIRVIVAADK